MAELAAPVAATATTGPAAAPAASPAFDAGSPLAGVATSANAWVGRTAVTASTVPPGAFLPANDRKAMVAMTSRAAPAAAALLRSQPVGVGVGSNVRVRG